MAASRPDDASARAEPKQVIAVYDGWGIAAGALVISRSTPASRAAKHVVMSRDDGVGCHRDAAKEAAAVVGGAILPVFSPTAPGWSGLDRGLHRCMSLLCRAIGAEGCGHIGHGRLGRTIGRALASKRCGPGIRGA
jgi:hypothetical protein